MISQFLRQKMTPIEAVRQENQEGRSMLDIEFQVSMLLGLTAGDIDDEIHNSRASVNPLVIGLTMGDFFPGRYQSNVKIQSQEIA